MLRLFKENKVFFYLMSVYLLAALFVQPWGSFPLNDDWSYTKSVIKFNEVGKIDIGEWPAMTLATHVVWGYLFVKIFGFSFFVLRLSTWVSMCIGIFSFYKLSEKLSGSKHKAVLAAAVLLFNPIYYNMSNTFMTDVNFLTLVILGVHVVYSFIEAPSSAKVLFVLLISIVITLLRQYGIVIPVAFVVVTLLIKEKRWLWFCLGLAVLVITYYIFHQYELYLKSYLTQWSAYKFSSAINPASQEFWNKMWYGISTRYKIVLIHVFFHTFMFTAAFLPAVVKQHKWWTTLLVFVPSYAGAWFLYDGYPLQVGNVFLDTVVGTDTTYETLTGTYIDGPHFFVRSIEKIIDFFKPLLIAAGFSTEILHLIKKRESKNTAQSKIFLGFVFLVLVGYLVLILITDSFFDRYQLPIIFLSLVLFAKLSVHYQMQWKLAVPFLAVWLYISIAGTHDYFALNNEKWGIIRELIDKEKVKPLKIHGTFEHVCWNEGNNADFWAFASLHTFDYLIQYKAEDSFKLDRERVFQRYWPLTKDTLRLYERYIFAKKAVTDSVLVNDTIKK